MLIVSGLGTIGWIVFLQRTAAVHGRDAFEDLPVMLGLCVFLGFGVAVMTVGPVWLFLRLGAKAPVVELEDGEKLVASQDVNFLVPSPRGAWFVTSRSYPTEAGWAPVLVAELVGEGLELARAPLSLPRPYWGIAAACPIGGQLALAWAGPHFKLVITDGVVVEESEGRMSPTKE